MKNPVSFHGIAAKLANRHGVLKIILEFTSLKKLCKSFVKKRAKKTNLNIFVGILLHLNKTNVKEQKLVADSPLDICTQQRHLSLYNSSDSVPLSLLKHIRPSYLKEYLNPSCNEWL
jgi:hypothetical protein